jgi:site-specific DNA recombinase
MQPDQVAVFVAEFTAEWNRLSAKAGAGRAGKQRDLEAVRRKMAGLVEAIADGMRGPAVQGRLDELEGRARVLEADLASVAAADLPRLHPNLTEVYRERVQRLTEALGQERGPEVVEANPPAEAGAGPRIELVGHLASLLRAAGAGRAGNAKSPPAGADGLEVFLRSELVGAGTRNRRCQYITVII